MTNFIIHLTTQKQTNGFDSLALFTLSLADISNTINIEKVYGVKRIINYKSNAS